MLARAIIFILLLPTFIATKTAKFNKENVVFAFDLDDTLAKYGTFYKTKVAGFGLNLLHPIRSYEYLSALNAMRKLTKTKKPVPGNHDATYPKLLGGAFLQLTYAGIHEKNLRQYVNGLIELIWNNTHFKEGIPELLTYLNEQGYELWIATNKDHVSYTQVLDSLSGTCSFNLSSLITHSFVTWPTKKRIEELYTFQSNTDEDAEFQKLIDLIPTIQETATIHHSHEPKPHKDYYDKMKAYTNKQIIFFDDKKENIAAADKEGILAYHVKNCREMIERLEKLGILDKEKDPTFYNRLKEKTVFKKILFWV